MFQAAKYLGVPAKEFIEEYSIWYYDKAMIAMTAEHQAEEIIRKRNKPK